MHEIDRVADLIKDGHWHLLDDVTYRAEIPQPEAKLVLEFLAHQKLVELDMKNGRVKANRA
ncbi:MAG: hypothetical protein JSV58_06955, partial [Candidatus Bathyarchaeota archaeon]